MPNPSRNTHGGGTAGHNGDTGSDYKHPRGTDTCTLTLHWHLDADALKNLLLVWVEMRDKHGESRVLGEGGDERGEVLLQVQAIERVTYLHKGESISRS